MTLSIVRLGSDRTDQGIRLGTVRRPPRGVRKEDYARLNYYDVWLPMLSPSPDLMKEGKAATDEKAWLQFKRAFKSAMSQPEPASVLTMLAAMSHQTDFSLGCYCEAEDRCHRSVLRELLQERGASLA